MGEVGAKDFSIIQKGTETLKNFNKAFDTCFGSLLEISNGDSDLKFVRKISDGERVIGVNLDLRPFEGIIIPEPLNKFFLTVDKYRERQAGDDSVDKINNISLFDVDGKKSITLESEKRLRIKLIFSSLKTRVGSLDVSPEISFSTLNPDGYSEKVLDRIIGEFKREKDHKFLGLDRAISDFIYEMSSNIKEGGESFRLVQIKKKEIGARRGRVRVKKVTSLESIGQK